MLLIDKTIIASFAKRYFIVYSLGVSGWEISQFVNKQAEYQLPNLIQATALFFGLYFVSLFLVSVFAGWIEYHNAED